MKNSHNTFKLTVLTGFQKKNNETNIHFEQVMTFMSMDFLIYYLIISYIIYSTGGMYVHIMFPTSLTSGYEQEILVSVRYNNFTCDM